MRKLIIIFLAAAGCSSDSHPDARMLPPQGNSVDAALPAVVDARVFDASMASGGDARAVDAAAGGADAAPATPDAAPAIDAAPPVQAELIINEVNANLGSRALIELFVTKGGTTAGWKLERDYRTGPTIVANLPDVVVATHDLIVIHMTPGGGTVKAETDSKSEFQTSENYDGAWDFFGNNDTIGTDNRILVLRAPDGTVDSVVPFFRPDISNPMRAFYPGDVQAAIDAALWNEVCDPAPCTYSSNLNEVTVSWTGMGDTPAGASVQRKAGAVDQHKASDWQAVPTTGTLNTFGLPN